MKIRKYSVSMFFDERSQRVKADLQDIINAISGSSEEEFQQFIEFAQKNNSKLLEINGVGIGREIK